MAGAPAGIVPDGPVRPARYSDRMARIVAVVGASRDRRKFGNKAVRAFAAAGDTNMCADREYDHRTIASGATFDFPFSPLPDGTALSDGRVVKGNEFRVAGFACANGSAPDVYFNNGQFILNHC